MLYVHFYTDGSSEYLPARWLSHVTKTDIEEWLRRFPSGRVEIRWS